MKEENVTFGGQEASLITAKELSELVKMMDAGAEPNHAINFVFENLTEEQRDKLFGSKAEFDERAILYGFPIYRKSWVPLGEIWMMNKKGEVIKKFKI